MPHLNQLHATFKNQGLVILGIHKTEKSETLPAFVKSAAISYPVAPDLDNKTATAFHANSIPGYYLVDRAGKLRFADLASSELDRAVLLLLKEPKPKKKAKVIVDARLVLKEAQKRAKSTKKNLLIHLGAPW
ncbi:MAG: hypothetical protein ACI97A_001646 [Planctomycetota bacterium]